MTGRVTLQQQFESGVSHHQAGRLAEAEKIYRQVLAQQANHADALHMLGMLAAQTGRSDAAEDLIRQAIRIQPDCAEAHNNLGNVLKAKGRLDEAIASYRHAIRLHPDFAEPHNNLGIAFKDNGQIDQAIASYHQAIRLKHDYAEAHSNLGNALKDQGQLDQAIASHRQAIRLRPDFAGAHSNLGNALLRMGHHDEAIASYRHAIRLRPGFVEAHSNLVKTLYCHPGYDAAMIYEELCRWNRQHAEPLKTLAQPHANNRDPDRRLRIGYVSPDFCRHAVGQNLLPLLREHDHRQVEIFCYSNVARPDALTDRIRRYSDAWRNIAGLPDSRAADLIRQDRIDILVDLMLHTREPSPPDICSQAGAGAGDLSGLLRQHRPGRDGLPPVRSLSGSTGFGFVVLQRADDPAAGNLLVLRPVAGPTPEPSPPPAAATRIYHLRLPEQFRQSFTARAGPVGGDSANACRRRG